MLEHDAVVAARPFHGPALDRIVPPLGFTSPATIISNVLLPHPDGPSTETNSLWVTDSVTSASACTASPPRP